MHKSFNLFFLLIIPFAWLLTRCANPVSPQGGPKDTSPPEVVASDPPNHSVQFREKGFTLDFNEYITLKNQASEIYFSPPLRNLPETRIRGKSLIIRFEDTLASSTTYAVNFGKAIADITESNILNGYRFVFSTGDYLDSLSLRGNLLTAFDHKPEKNILVELYADNNDTLAFDSLPFLVAPGFITKTDEKGNFIFDNLPPGRYKLFALGDQNSDLIFNQITEKVAFLDSLVSPCYEPPPKSDSLGTDTIQSGCVSYPMFLFEENDSIQRILKSTAFPDSTAILVFRFPAEPIRLTPLNFDSTESWYISETSMKRDSLRLWITRPGTDTIRLSVQAGPAFRDTITLEFPRPSGRKKTADPELPPRLSLQLSVKSPGLNQFRFNPEITFSAPLKKWDFSGIILSSEKDTLTPEILFSDSIRRKIVIRHQWEEERPYRITIPDSALFDIHDLTQDTVRIDFRTRAEREFGNLVVSFAPKDSSQYIIQLLNEKETVRFDERIVTGKSVLRFDYLSPGKYRLKAIVDRNRNRRWDTGIARKKIQPEEVFYYEKIMEIRANWEIEEKWDQ